MKEISVMGIDLAKNVFEIHGRDSRGAVILRKTIQRKKLLEFIGELSPCLIGIEACGGSHYWGREFEKRGHKVRMISPQFVKPYVKSNKNDQADAEAICEAMMRPNMRFVPLKGAKQQDWTIFHRIRERLVKNRTALINEIRGLLQEYGIVFSQGPAAIRKGLCEVVSQRDLYELSEASRECFEKLQEELSEIEGRIAGYEKKISMLYRENEVCQRLGTIPGVGPITATALVAACASGHEFKRGREFSAWLGLVPRQCSSGGKSRLLGISKRGDSYLRKLLVHGARAALLYSKDKTDRQSVWVQSLRERRGFNKACVALANKNARVAWVIMTTEAKYQVRAA